MVVTLISGEIVKVHNNTRALAGVRIPKEVVTEKDLGREVLGLRIGEKIQVQKGTKYTFTVQRLAHVKDSKFLVYLKHTECFVPATRFS